jgi:hypothetical protein
MGGGVKHGRVDANQKEIVDGLRQVGARVQVTSDVGKGFPDLVVSFRGVVYLIETKTENGKLTPDQVDWHNDWQCAHIVKSVDEALKIIGAI